MICLALVLVPHMPMVYWTQDIHTTWMKIRLGSWDGKQSFMPLTEMRTVGVWSIVSHNYLSVIILLHLFFTVYHVKEDGWIKVSQTDVKELYYKYQDEKEQL